MRFLLKPLFCHLGTLIGKNSRVLPKLHSICVNRKSLRQTVVLNEFSVLLNFDVDRNKVVRVSKIFSCVVESALNMSIRTKGG